MKKEFAVIETGGKQYQVSIGDVISIEKINGDSKEGDSFTFDKVVLVDDGEQTTVGTPYIDKRNVKGVLKEQGRAKKIDVIHYKSKSRYFKKYGHRQPFMKVEITSI